MAGILGIVSDRPADECKRIVESMLDAMNYANFFQSGTVLAPEIGVYAGWVAHENSFAANQCAYDERTDQQLIWSGECFVEDPAQGGKPTPEGLLRLFEESGDACVETLNGLFSGLYIDRKNKRALLCNDRYGIERLYSFERNGTTIFATEAKALLRVAAELRNFDEAGVAQFLAFGCTIGEQTLFRNVRVLPGGSLWTIENRQVASKKRYFLPQTWESQETLSEDAFEVEFLQTFERILPRYLAPDSGIGISLTGGLDTRMIMACLPDTPIKPVSYTFGGLSGETLDVRLARRVAEECGLTHRILRIQEDFLSNYGDYIDRTVTATDGCAGAITAHEIYFNEQARAINPIRLTGNFGSEILRSMSTFKPSYLAKELVDPDFFELMDKAVATTLGQQMHPVSFAAFQEIPYNLFGSMVAGKSQVTFKTPYLDNEIVRLAFRAPSAARQSSDAALRLVNTYNAQLARIPTDLGLLHGDPRAISLIRRLVSKVTFKLDYLHKEGLPNWLSPVDPLIDSLNMFGLLGLHKYLPYRRWFRAELNPLIREVLSDTQIRTMSWCNPKFLESVISDHSLGKKNYVREINALLTLEAVERCLIRNGTDDF